MTLKGVSWATVMGGSAVNAACLAGCVAFAADGPPLEYVRLALVALVAAAAFVLDEPAAAAVDAVPQTRRQRTVARSLVVMMPLAVWTVGIGALELRSTMTPALALLVEGAGVLAVTVALAAGLRFAGNNEPGEVVASVLGAAMLGVLVFHPPAGSVPLFPVDTGWAASSVLWGCLAVAAMLLVVAASRDPYRR